MIPLYTGKVYNNVLNTKALLLSSSVKLLENILNSNDSTLIAKYNQWVAEKEFLINAMNLSKQSLQEQGISLAEIEANAERLEKEMAQRSELFASEYEKVFPTWLKVKSSLVAGEAAIEIIRFRTFNKTFTDSVCYAALIVRNEKLKLFPDYVVMGNGKLMEGRYLKYYRNCSVFDTRDEYSYSIYWKSIKSKLKDRELVYLSSDGVYNQINLEMLPDSSGNYLIDQNQLVLLTNTRDLIVSSSKQKAKEVKKKSGDRFVLCGSPEFYTNKSQTKNVQDLPGAEKEINEIYNLLSTSAKDSWKLLNEQVEEDTIKKLVSPKVLHIATHGYFKEVKSDVLSEDDITTNPLLNSGILLRGSGDILDNKSNSYVNQKDGILTALEAMDMNLDKTDLVILSACETGRGSVQAGEGVYGLQRAFLLAGSKAVVISLFKVNDEVTQKLMLSFYTKWLATGDKRQAFVDAKREIKETYHKPVNWGAFIMIEGKPDRLVKN
jgi:CHAT domain-containing protein